MKYDLSQEQFEAIHQVADTGRKPIIKLKRDDVAALLRDHSKLIKTVEDLEQAGVI